MSRHFVVVLVATLTSLVGCGDRPVFGRGNGGVDASFDANTTDTGGLRDAAADARDASLDAPAVDALPEDVGLLADVTLGDVGLPDVGLPDVGLPDVGLPDVGLPDVGLPDVGPILVDAGTDAGRDAGRDAGSDAGSDAGRDAGSDAGVADAGRPDAGPHLGPAPVDLGDGDLASPGGYVILAETAITNVIGSMISGDVGISPGSSAAVTGFALILDSTGRFSSSASVVPPAHVYAADYLPPTGANLVSAVMEMEDAYTDAAGRTGPDFTNLLLGHIGGLVLVPGLYRWTTAVDVTTGITLAGGPNDVWIFQVGSDLDVSAAATMTLTGGARAENVFWQVTGGTTIGAGARFEGIILSLTSVRMESGAALHGRAFAQTFVSLDNANVTAP